MEWKIPWSGRSHDFTNEEIEFIVEVIKSADPLTQGKYLKLFEEKLANYLGVNTDNIYAVNSATSALELIATLLNLQEGDEVIIPAHTFCASAIPFLRRGAKIIWADIDPDTWVIGYEDVLEKITPRTKAIVLVHLYGVPADIDKFLELKHQYNFFLVEDAAQAFGAMYKGKKVGVLTDFGAYSFHAQKNLTTFGEGGAIYVKDKELAEKIPPLRSFGFVQFKDKEFYWKPAMINVDSVIDWELPFKFTISEIQCAIGYKLLDRIDELNKKREERYWYFRNELSKYEELKFQKISEGITPSYHLLPAKYEGEKYGIKANRDDFIKLCAFKYKIQVIVQYYPLYRYDLFKKWGAGTAQCPNTDEFFDNMVSFPFHVWMSDNDFEYMVESVKKVLDELRERRG